MKTIVPNGWKRVFLDELREPGEYSLVGGPFGSDLTTKDYVDTPGIPVIRGTNLGGTDCVFIDRGFVFVSDRKGELLERNSARPGDLIFTQRGTLGQVAVIPDKATYSKYIVSQSQMKLTPNRNLVETRYLYRYFRTPQALSLLQSQTLATGVPHINLGILKRFPVPLPPLAEQRRIADILDRADALRADRRAALALLDTLPQAIFLDMFGDPVSNPRAWPDSKLDGQLVFQQYGPRFYNEAYTSDGTPIVRITDLDGYGRLDFTAMPRMAVADEDLTKYGLRQGDIIFARTGATVGKVAMIAPGDPVCIAGAYFITMRFAPAVEPTYARYLLAMPSVQEIVRVRSQQSAQQNFSGPGLRSLPFPLPPLPLQQEFARRVAAVEQLRSAHRAALAKLDELFAGLQYRAFAGEL